MAIKQVHDLDEAIRKSHEQHWGGYNDFPPNWQEISEKEFAQGSFFTYTPELVESRQMYERDGNTNLFTKAALTATLYFYHDGNGVAVSSDFWAGKVRYFKFWDCKHERTQMLEQSNCYRRWTCLDCRRVFFVDSSD